MTPRDLEKRRQRAGRVRHYVGLALLAAAAAWSATHVAVRSFGPDSDTALVAGKTVIRFAHWQLEGRTVDALNEACREYTRLHPDVAVRQIEVPERAYEQWVRTQLIGRTAPDLIELRDEAVWRNLIARYFVVITELVDRPNPYNAAPNFCDDPNLAGLPWRETYVDDMQGGFIEELRDHYGVPLSVFTIRCFANRDILRAAAGSDRPPATLGEFFELCRAIEAYAARRRERDGSFRLVPVAGSRYTAEIFGNQYWTPSVWALLDRHDTDLSGQLEEDERIEAVLTGRLDLATDPCIRAGHRALYDITRHFSAGFMSDQRDQAVLLFSQGRAAMIATGSWDAGSLWRQVAGDFEIIVFDFPVPAPGEPYGRLIRNRVSEAGARAGFPLGLTRTSRHKDQAIDFMQFLTSKRINERINEQFRWFPAIRGAAPDRILEPFRPQMEGVYKVFDMHLTGTTQLRYQNRYEEYMSAADPGPEEYRRFLRAAAGDRRKFLATYGGLARRCLADSPDRPEHMPFGAYVEAWRDDLYDRFIRAYAADYRECALADSQRNWANGHHAVVQTDGPLAQLRARAMREQLRGATRRNLAALVVGQVERVRQRANHRAAIERLRIAADVPPTGQGARP